MFQSKENKLEIVCILTPPTGRIQPVILLDIRDTWEQDLGGAVAGGTAQDQLWWQAVQVAHIR